MLARSLGADYVVVDEIATADAMQRALLDRFGGTRADGRPISIFGVLREVNASGVALLLVEQNAHKALQLAHRAYVLETGNVVMTGTGQKLLASPEVRRAYLGE